MHRPVPVLATLATLATLVASAAPLLAQTRASAGETRRALAIGGQQRSYLLYRPERTTARAALPVLFVFHGGSGTARGIARHTGFTRLAKRDGVIVVYPQGAGRRWNDGRGIHASYDDVAFVRALLDTLRRELPIDPQRVYATGISNGGVFVHRLACDLPGTFAAIAPVAAGFPARLETRCTGTGAGTRPVAVVAFQGTADRMMPYHGSADAARRGAVVSAERTAALWARINGCTGAPADSLVSDRYKDGTRVRLRRYAGCGTGRTVQLYRVEGGGHTWPGGPAAAASVGRGSREVDATAEIWRFFLTNR